MTKVKWVLSTVGIVLLLLSCQSTAPVGDLGVGAETASNPTLPAPEETDVAEIYLDLEYQQSEYQVGLDLVMKGEVALGEERIAAATQGLEDLAEACSREPGCEVSRVLNTLSELLGEQRSLLRMQALEIDSLEMNLVEAEETLREPETSAFVEAMPEIGRTQAFLRGTDLRDIINLNGPVKAALDDWLTWMRPMLMDAYENYQFLRDEIAPIYGEAGLPEALLFAIMATETGGRVHSYSRAGAAGPLQFMRYTGRKYGLREVDGFDMRLDPVASTRANVAYLNDQFKILNDSLEKTLAAYNGGETRVRGLNRRLRGASFWDNRFYYSLPRETREYVPRILAAAWLFLHSDEYGLELPNFRTERTQLAVQQEIALDELALCLGQSGNQPNGWFRTLRNLNPRLGPGDRVKAGETIEFPTLLLEDYEARCVGNDLAWVRELHDANYPPASETILYTVRRGDTLGRIASRFGCTSIRELATLNRLQPPKYVIRVGQRLRIPNC